MTAPIDTPVVTDGKPTEPATGADGKPVDDKLGEPGLAALQKERDAAKAFEARAKAAEAKIAEAERAKLTADERTALEATEHKTRADAAEAKLARLEVAVEKGLTPAQAKRLSGTTREELEADADELLELFGKAKPGDDDKPPAGGKAREALSGGGRPGDPVDETDPGKLAALIPRS